MNPKSFGNLVALTTGISLASSAMAKSDVQRAPSLDTKDAYCINGILTDQIDTNVCDAETVARLISLIQANIDSSSIPDEINQGTGGQQKALQFDSEIQL